MGGEGREESGATIRDDLDPTKVYEFIVLHDYALRASGMSCMENGNDPSLAKWEGQ